jgi:antitoxin (DNA-binding transcriptional repressor) of toxin-antitoxin stability system
LTRGVHLGKIEHVRHPSFGKDDHVATLERNDLRLEVVGFGLTREPKMATLVTIKGKSMTHVGIREFKDKATTLLASGETLVVERHGKTVGFYIPIEAKDRTTGQAALEHLENIINGILERTGMTEDELLDDATRR